MTRDLDRIVPQTEKATHTPGPWTFDSPRNWVGHRWKCSVRGGESGSAVAEVYLGGQTALSCEADAVEANARLISAAPELLEALKALNDELINGQNVPSLAVMEQIRAAIRKAEGHE